MWKGRVDTVNDGRHFRELTRRELLRTMGVAAGALAAGPTLASCGGLPGSSGSESQGSGARLELWTFVDTHARWFQAMAKDYKQKVNPNFELKVTQIAGEEMFDKLRVALQSGGVGAPDIADIEQGAFGGFLRGGDPGLVDISGRLKEGDYLDKLVAAREALYTFEGKIYGIEHALTPVVLYYRADVWEKVGADPSGFETWDDYIAGAREATKGGVKALPFPEHEAILRQRGGDYFDKDGQVTLDSDLSIETMQWILGLRDEHQIADERPDSDPAWWAAVKGGKFVSVVGADWYAGFLKDNVPDMKGKWRAIPLPAWDKGEIRTSCLGGTGACIVSTSKNVEESWKYLERCLLTTEGEVRQFEMTNLWPPFKPAWEDKRLHARDAYFSNQDLGGVFAKVGPDVPPEYQSPYRAQLNTELATVLPDVLAGKKEPAGALRKVAEDVRKAMSEGQS